MRGPPGRQRRGGRDGPGLASAAIAEGIRRRYGTLRYCRVFIIPTRQKNNINAEARDTVPVRTGC